MMNVIYFKSVFRVCMVRCVFFSVVNVLMKCYVIILMEFVLVFVYLVGWVINVIKVS